MRPGRCGSTPTPSRGRSQRGPGAPVTVSCPSDRTDRSGWRGSSPPPAARRGAARGRWPLLVAGEADAETVLWVIGVRRAAAAPVTRDTRTALRVRLEL